jgi:YVTN family beta-propeller protein
VPPRRDCTFVSCFLAVPTHAQGFFTHEAYITNSGSNTVSVIDVAAHRVLTTIPVGIGPYGVAVGTDTKVEADKKVYVGAEDGTVSVIGFGPRGNKELEVVATIKLSVPPVGLAVTPDRTKVYATYPATNAAGDSFVSVIDTATNSETAMIPHVLAFGVAVSPDGGTVYFAQPNQNNVLAFATATNMLVAGITVRPNGTSPTGVAVSPDGGKVYVTNKGSNNVSVIDTTINAVTATIPVGTSPIGVSVSKDGRTVYVANNGSNNVSVIDTAGNAVRATIPVGTSPIGVTVRVAPQTPHQAFVANNGSNGVSEIDTRTNTVTRTLPVGKGPVAFGMFISPGFGPRSLASFAGTPGFSNCEGQSIAALDRQFGGHNAAAAALGLPDVQALENAILAFCR